MEEKTSMPNECCSTEESHQMFGYSGSELAKKQLLAAKLRALMDSVDGDAKCTMCQAAEELVKPEKGSFMPDWSFLIMMLIFSFGSSFSKEDLAVFNAALTATLKEDKEDQSKL